MYIRELQETELDCFYNALKRSAMENGVGDRFQEKKLLQDAIFKEKHCSTLVVDIESNLVAYLLYSMTQRNFTLHRTPGFYIHSVYVDIPYRRRKIGTKLVEALVKKANERDFGRIEFALLQSNKIGDHFLESLSFKEIDFIKPMRLTINK